MFLTKITKDIGLLPAGNYFWSLASHKQKGMNDSYKIKTKKKLI